MTPLFRPLHHRGARHSAERLVRQYGFDPAEFPLLATPLDWVRHAVRVNTLPADLLDQLHAVEHWVDPDTLRVVRRRVPLWVRRGSGYELPGRLVTLVVQYLARQTGRPPTPAAGMNVTAFPDVLDPLVPAALAAFGRAVVRYGPGVNLIRLLADVIRAHPGRRVAVVCLNRRTAGQVAADLRRLGLDAEAYIDFRVDARRRPAAAVGTPAGLASPSAAVDHAGLVVVLDPAGCCGTRGIALRMSEKLARARWLGLLPADRTLSPLERDMISAVFGFACLDLPAHGRVLRRVLFDGQRITRPEGRGYERVVMQVAAALAAGAGVSDAYGVVRRAVEGGVAGPVVVLADDRRQQQQLRQLRRGAARNTVTVVTPAELADLIDVGVVVRADRRTPCPPLDQIVLTELQTARTPLLVVDAAAAADPLVRVRQRNYRKAGWVPVEAELGGWADWDAWVHRPLGGGTNGG